MLGLLKAAYHYAADRGTSFDLCRRYRIFRGTMIDALRRLD